MIQAGNTGRLPGRIGLIAVDMDGTLLNPKGKVTERTVQAIRQAQAQGIIFAICTGRFFENASILIRDVGLDCPIIAMNGGLTALGPFGKRIASHMMDSKTAWKAYERLEQLQAIYYVFADGLVATRDVGDRHHSLVDFGERMIHEAGVRYTYGKMACQQAIHQDIYKFYVHANQDAQELRRVRQGLDDMAGLVLTQSSEHNIEIMPPLVDKGQGVRDLAAYYGIPMSQVMTIGDQDNDLPMIRAAGAGIAMANATPEVLAEADAITASNREDGVAQAILRYALSGSGQA